MTVIDPARLSGYADQVMAMVDEDIASTPPGFKRMPADVASFTDLHDYRDANCYLLDLFDAHWEDSPGTAFVFSDEGTDWCNAICGEVARRLAGRAPVIRRRMAETVLYAIAAGWEGTYGEYAGRAGLDLDPDGLSVDDDDVDGAAAWLLNGRPAQGAEVLICTECDDDLTRDADGTLRDTAGDALCAGIDQAGPHQTEWHRRPVCHCGTLPHPRGAAVGCVHEDPEPVS